MLLLSHELRLGSVVGAAASGCSISPLVVRLRGRLSQNAASFRSLRHQLAAVRICHAPLADVCAPRKQRKSRLTRDQAAFQLVPRRGLEPPRSYPLVPETSASTNSATWASQEAASIARNIASTKAE